MRDALQAAALSGRVTECRTPLQHKSPVPGLHIRLPRRIGASWGTYIHNLAVGKPGLAGSSGTMIATVNSILETQQYFYHARY
jgi:hypothetical protein